MMQMFVKLVYWNGFPTATSRIEYPTPAPRQELLERTPHVTLVATRQCDKVRDGFYVLANEAEVVVRIAL